MNAGRDEKLLEVRHIAGIEEQQEVPWLIEGLFLENAVGILCGSPKAHKSWLALDLALSVATQTPVAGTFPVPVAGPVLLVAAEDPPAAVRTRLSGLAARRAIPLDDAPIHLVLAHALRLDQRPDQERLRATVRHFSPKLLVLDPFVRVFRIDENSSLEVSAALGYLRELQRQLHVSILLVHHTRKARSNDRAGLALRGSGDFWAWSDTTLYLRRKDHALELVVEHRSAEDPKPSRLALDTTGQGGPFLRLVNDPPQRLGQQASNSLAQRILDHLAKRHEPCRLHDLRRDLRVRMQTLVDELRSLRQKQSVRRENGGWSLPPERPQQKTC